MSSIHIKTFTYQYINYKNIITIPSLPTYFHDNAFKKLIRQHFTDQHPYGSPSSQAFLNHSLAMSLLFRRRRVPHFPKYGRKTEKTNPCTADTHRTTKKNFGHNRFVSLHAGSYAAFSFLSFKVPEPSCTRRRFPPGSFSCTADFPSLFRQEDHCQQQGGGIEYIHFVTNAFSAETPCCSTICVPCWPAPKTLPSSEPRTTPAPR